MFDLERLSKNGFKIINGSLRDRYGCSIPGCISDVVEFGWGSPCIEYHFTNYELNEYSIVKSVHYDEWYLKKNGYTEICKLRYLGDKSWETY